MGKGKSDLSLRRIREIRGYSGRYGNCSHGNQGIAQVIWQEAVIIQRYFTVRDLLVGPSAAPCNGNIADGRIKWGYPFGRIRYFTEQDVLVSSSVDLCNGNIADRRLKWRCPLGRLKTSRNLRRNWTRVVQIKAVGYQIGGINCGKASWLQRISEH